MKKEILFSVLVLILCTYLQFGRQETVLFSRISATETTCTHKVELFIQFFHRWDIRGIFAKKL